MDNVVRTNLKIGKEDNPLLHEDLSARKPRGRAKRIEQLAYLGLFYENQLKTGADSAANLANALKALPPEVVASTNDGQIREGSANASPSSNMVVSDQNESQTADSVLMPPSGFGDDMSSLFDGGISLNVR